MPLTHVENDEPSAPQTVSEDSKACVAGAIVYHIVEDTTTEDRVVRCGGKRIAQIAYGEADCEWPLCCFAPRLGDHGRLPVETDHMEAALGQSKSVTSSPTSCIEDITTPLDSVSEKLGGNKVTLLLGRGRHEVVVRPSKVAIEGSTISLSHAGAVYSVEATPSMKPCYLPFLVVQ